MLTIRLARVGKTKQAQYRMVVADHRRAVTGRFIDVVGAVNPRTEPTTVTLKKHEISEWLKKGAQPSATVRTILVRESLIDAPKQPQQRPSKAPKRPDKFGKAEAAPAAEAPAAEGENAEATETEAPAETTPEEAPAEQPQTEESLGSTEEAAPAEAEPESADSEPPAESPPEGDTQA